MIQIGINKIVYIVLGIFLLKISFIDPIINAPNKVEKESRKPASVRVKTR